MKKLFLSLFVAGALTFGLQSCGDEPCDDVTCAAGEICDNGDCVTDPNTAYDCTECGTYNTEATGAMNIANGTVLDTTWTDTNKVVIVADFIQTGNEYSLSVDLSGISSLLAAPINVEGSYNTTTKIFTVSDFAYSVAGVAEVLVNGTADFSTSNQVSGDLVITAPASASVPVDGNLVFEGSK